MHAGDPQRLTQACGAGTQRSRRHAAAPAPHRRETGEWLEGADQHRRREPVPFGDGIETPVHTVGEIDVAAARRPVSYNFV